MTMEQFKLEAIFTKSTIKEINGEKRVLIEMSKSDLRNYLSTVSTIGKILHKEQKSQRPIISDLKQRIGELESLIHQHQTSVNFYCYLNFFQVVNTYLI